MSKAVAARMSEARVRRLVEIELEDDAILAPGTVGPLGDHVAYVWVDLPSPTTVLIEVRVGDRAVARRQIVIRGLSWDVVARFIAIAASEMIRVQMRPLRPKKSAAPPAPSARALELAARDRSAVDLAGAGSFAFVPEANAWLAGSTLALGFRSHRATESVFARWLGGDSDVGSMRWFEAGLAGDYRIWLSDRWRLALGGAVAGALLRLPEASSVSGSATERDAWSARLGGVAAAELRVAPRAWLALSLEPGVVLRSVAYVDQAGEPGALRGAWLGVGLVLHIEP